MNHLVLGSCDVITIPTSVERLVKRVSWHVRLCEGQASFAGKTIDQTIFRLILRVQNSGVVKRFSVLISIQNT